MSRISSVLAALLLAAALAPNAALADATPEPSPSPTLAAQTANYRTFEVQPTEFLKTVNLSADTYYPVTVDLRFEGANAKFAESFVSRGDEVKQGDPLMRFTLEVSETDVLSRELSIRRAEEAYEKGLEDYAEALRTANASAAGATDALERERLKLQARRVELQTRRYVLEQERYIGQLKQALEDLMENRRDLYLYAPSDGKITSLTYLRIGDAVYSGTSLGTLADESVMLLYAANPSMYLRYGASVTVQSGPARERQTYTGKVVACDDSIPVAKRLGYALIQLDEGQGPFKALQVTVTTTTMLVGDVFVLPTNVVTIENGSYYVTKLENGALQKRYIEVARSGQRQYWVTSGVQAGDVVIIDS